MVIIIKQRLICYIRTVKYGTCKMILCSNFDKGSINLAQSRNSHVIDYCSSNRVVIYLTVLRVVFNFQGLPIKLESCMSSRW